MKYLDETEDEIATQLDSIALNMNEMGTLSLVMVASGLPEQA